MKKGYAVLQGILNLIVGYISSLYVIIGYAMMTNTAKLNNTEGEGFLQLIGIVMLLLWLVIVIGGNYCYNKRVQKMKNKGVVAINVVMVLMGVAIKVWMMWE